MTKHYRETGTTAGKRKTEEEDAGGGERGKGAYNCETNSSSIQIEKTVFGHIVFVCSLYSFTNLHCFPLQLNDEIYAVRPRV